MHGIPNSWIFDGNYETPTVSPSVKITGKQTVKDEQGETGDWICGADGKALDLCCHYILTMGQLNFCDDCTHELAGKTVPLPELPVYLRD